VSHLKERKEKICLNCRAELHGLYCHLCGQANTEPKESAWHLVTHFFYDITHFDGKFFTTLKDLIGRPGFLSREYMLGRRASYLNPVRMYVFTSAFFFIIFFSIFNVDRLQIVPPRPTKIDSALNLRNIRKEALKDADNKEDSQLLNKALGNLSDTLLVSADSSDKTPFVVHSKFDEDLNPFTSVEQYDSMQKSLIPSKRDGFIKHMFKRKAIELKIKYKNNGKEFFKEMSASFLHQLPKMLFISLPIVALLLQLLYVRRHQFFYVDHCIFIIHLYIFYFILLLFWFGLREMRQVWGWSWLGSLTLPIFLFSQYYYYRAMYIFYKQGWFKTFLKYILLNMLSFIVFLFLFVFFILFSALEI
jgi:hypothetical protein